MIKIASEVSRLLECTAPLCALEKGSLFSGWVQPYARAQHLASRAQDEIQFPVATSVRRTYAVNSLHNYAW